jgi:dienelactone hydrolase
MRHNGIGNIGRRQFLAGSAMLAGATVTGGIAGVMPASAAPAQKMVPYQVKDRTFEGMIVYDDSVTTRRPAVFMQPDWTGVSPNMIAQARAIAGKDYVVLLADMFGAGWGAKQRPVPELAGAMKAIRGDLPFTLACGSAALDAMLGEANKLGLVDTAKTVALGYCAGGGFLLEHARAGADFKAVVVFHVSNPSPADPAMGNKIKGRVLLVHGSADPVTSKAQMDALQEELTKAKVDWQVMMISNAVHSFCGPKDNPRHCRMSHAMMRDFFSETL